MAPTTAFITNSAADDVDMPWSPENLPTKLFINNEYIDSKSDKYIAVYDPKDGTLVSDRVALADEQDIEDAVDAAEAAFPAWRKTPPDVRRDMLLNLASLVHKHAASLAAMTRLTLGAPVSGMGAMEVASAAEALRYFAGWTDKLSGETFPDEDGFFKIVRQEPLGVTCGIIAWNAPIAGFCTKAGPALATGNCFILKLSEKTPFAGLAMGSLIKAAGFPAGVLQVLSGDGSTGAVISSHKRIRKVSFTGSTLTGKKIQEAAARSNLKRVTLELGGKSPALVFDDANIENAVTWCVGAVTMNTGQACFAATRVYVQSGVHTAFVARYKAMIEEKTQLVGNPDDPKTFIGPVVDKSQFDRVMGFIQRGKNQGKLLVGGNRLEDKARPLQSGGTTAGFYIAPTVFLDVAEDAEIIRQEIFGPVAIINRFESEEEVLRLANDTPYGLMAGIFTKDVTRAMRLAAELDSAMVGVNAVSTSFLQTPFGGTKQSGIGRENGIHAIRSYTEPKTVFINMNA